MGNRSSPTFGAIFKMAFTVYILEIPERRFNIGQTDDLQNRIAFRSGSRFPNPARGDLSVETPRPRKIKTLFSGARWKKQDPMTGKWPSVNQPSQPHSSRR